MLYNPFQIVIQAAEKLFPQIECRIVFAELEGKVGETLFPDDGSAPVISIDPDGSYRQIVELLAHELAHVAVGPDAEHGPAWVEAYRKIENEYLKAHRKIENF